MAEAKKENKQDSLKKEVKPVSEDPKPEVKEVLVKTEKDTATKPTTFEERAEIEAEVEMIKVGKDSAGRWLWVRSDRLTSEHKKQRADMLDKIRKGIQL